MSDYERQKSNIGIIGHEIRAYSMPLFMTYVLTYVIQNLTSDHSKKGWNALSCCVRVRVTNVVAIKMRKFRASEVFKDQRFSFSQEKKYHKLKTWLNFYANIILHLIRLKNFGHFQKNISPKLGLKWCNLIYNSICIEILPKFHYSLFRCMERGKNWLLKTWFLETFEAHK